MHQESRKGSSRNASPNPDEQTPLLTAQTNNNLLAVPSSGQDRLTNGHTDASGSHTPWTHEDSRPWVSYPASFLRLTWLTLASNYVNVLLVFVPLGIVSGILGWAPTTVFILNFLAIIPLAALLSFATEEVSAELGQTIGGLMNASFGNAVELIVAVMALSRDEIVIVQTGMLGSILSNILLVLGCCFISGGVFGAEGWRGSEQTFSMTAANTMSDMLAVAR
jgi:Ca2+:H+ antiporter